MDMFLLDRIPACDIVNMLQENGSDSQTIASTMFVLKTERMRFLLNEIISSLDGEDLDDEDKFFEAVDVLTERIGDDIHIGVEEVEELKGQLNFLPEAFRDELVLVLNSIITGDKLSQNAVHDWSAVDVEEVRTAVIEQPDVYPQDIIEIQADNFFLDVVQQVTDEVVVYCHHDHTLAPESVRREIDEGETVSMPVGFDIVQGPVVVDHHDNVAEHGFSMSSGSKPNEYVYCQDTVILKAFKRKGIKRFAGRKDIFEPMFGSNCFSIGDDLVGFLHDTSPGEGDCTPSLAGVNVPSSLARIYKLLGTGIGRQFYMHKKNRGKVIGFYKTNFGKKNRKKRPSENQKSKSDPQPEDNNYLGAASLSDDRDWGDTSPPPSPSPERRGSPVPERRRRSSKDPGRNPNGKKPYVLTKGEVKDIIQSRPTYGMYAQENFPCGSLSAAKFTAKKDKSRNQKISREFLYRCRSSQTCDGIHASRLLAESCNLVRDWFDLSGHMKKLVDEYAAMLLCLTASGFRIKEGHIYVT